MRNIKKLNNVGLKLIEYKDELSKDYSPIVRDALLNSLEQMVESGIIDIGIYEAIKNNNEGKDDFILKLMNSDKYIKSHEELLEEYEVIRKEIGEELVMHDLSDLTTGILVEEDSITILKTFVIDGNFVMDYFGVDEVDLDKLMKRKGFVEKFTALRLVKITNDIISRMKNKNKFISLDHSMAYFDEDGDGYKIDLIMKVIISDLLVLDKKNIIISEIKETTNFATKIYNSKIKA